MTTIMMTTTVEAAVSFLEGQVTFFSSTLTSRRNWTLFEIPGVDLKINLPFIIAFGVFAFFAILVYVLLNKPKIGDFLIETELEMKKISWPGRSELVDSSTIVIVTVVILALVIMVFDFMIQFFMRLIGRM